MKKSIGYFLYIIPFHKTTITGRVVTNKQILSKIEAEEQWRKFYSYDMINQIVRLVLLTIILSPGALQLIIPKRKVR